jgi:ABC-2 type transport system permease protein
MQKKLERQSPVLTRFRITFEQIFAIAEADFRRLLHDPFELFARMVQPAIWLLIFGQAMEKARVIPISSTSYLDFISPGILAQSVLFISIFYGIALIWDRDMGILQRILVSPAPRVSLVFGRAIAAGVRSLSQVVLIYILALFLGIDIRWEIPALLGVFAIIMLGGALFSTLSLIIASWVKQRERFMGIGQILTMPLFFASNALYPITLMPTWLRHLSTINPLSYQVDALRHLMIKGEISQFGLPIDFIVTILIFVALTAIATVIYPKILD